MKRIYRTTAFASAIIAALAVSPALAEKGLGPYYDTKYESWGITNTHPSRDGSVVVEAEEIRTINCNGCDTQWLAPGVVFHMRNMSKKPICAAFTFGTTSTGRRPTEWGSGAAYYLKGGKQAKKFAGLFYISGGGSGTRDIGYSYKIVTWAPGANKSCDRTVRL